MPRRLLKWISLLTAVCLLAGLMLPVFAAEGENPPPDTAPAPDPDPEPVPTPAPDPEPVPTPDPIPQPEPDPVPGPEPTPEPQPAPDPEPAPEPSAAPAPVPSPDPVPTPTEPEKPPAPEPIRLDPYDPGPELPPEVEGEIEIREDGLHYEIPEDWTAQDLIAWFIHHYDLDADSFAVSFYCPATGERAAWNEDAYFLAASTYKLPLNMYYYEQEAAGVYSSSTIVGETTLSQAHMQSLLWSVNEVSEAMIYYLGSFYTYKKLMTERYGGIPDDEYPMAFWGNNYYSTAFMVSTLTYLYEHLEDFPELVDYLKQAMSGYFLQKYSGDIPVAHKYGMVDTNLHDVGILFTEEPCLVAIYTHDYLRNVYGEELIARLGKAFIDYQTQRTELNRLAAEEAAATEAETEPAPETETPPVSDGPDPNGLQPVRPTVPISVEETESAPETEAPQTTESGTDGGRSAPEEFPFPWYWIALAVLLAAGAAGVTGFLLFRKGKGDRE